MQQPADASGVCLQHPMKHQFPDVLSNFVFMSHLSLSLAGLSWRNLLAAHIPAAWVAMGATIVAGLVAVVLRHWSAPPALLLLTTAILTACAGLLFVRNWPREWLNADVRWALDLLVSMLPRRLRFLVIARGAPATADAQSSGGTR